MSVMCQPMRLRIFSKLGVSTISWVIEKHNLFWVICNRVENSFNFLNLLIYVCIGWFSAVHSYSIVSYVPVFLRKTCMQSAFPCFNTSSPVPHRWCTFLTPCHGRSLFWQLLPRLHSSSLGYIMPWICTPTFINNTTI